jgi:hypothetical protein
MTNDSTTQEQKGIKKKHLSRKSKLLIVLAVFFLINLIIYKPFTPSPAQKRHQQESQKVILKAIAAQLNKKPENLTSNDFTNIEELRITNEVITDIKPLTKLKNLQTLILGSLKLPEIELTKQEKFLAKLHLLNPSDREYLDLNPLKKLTSLQTLCIVQIKIKSIEPLTKIRSLQCLKNMLYGNQ